MENKKNKHVSFTIDLNKIPESSIVTTDKNGEPFQNGNRYVHCIAFINEEPDQYGNIVNVALKGKKEEKTIYIGYQKEFKKEDKKEE